VQLSFHCSENGDEARQEEKNQAEVEEENEK
jgi:hypothetical protein